MSKDLIPTQEEVKAIEVMAKQAHESKYADKLGGYAGIFSIAMYARELNVPIMSALFGGMSNIMGKITIAPQLMNAMIRKAGHKLKIDSSDLKCVIEGTRKDTGEKCEVSFSLEDARKAGLIKPNGGWEKYPSDMCFARALSRLARRLFPDVIGMAYVEDEIEDEKEPKKDDTIDLKEDDDDAVDPIKPTLATDFIDKFQGIRNMDYDLDDFVNFISEKSGKSADDTIKQAIKHTDKFSKSYLKWVEEKIAMEAKPIDVKAEPVDMLNMK